MKNAIIAIAVILILCANVFADPLTLNEIAEAACRVKSSRAGSYGQTKYAYGSGTVVYSDENYYYILTNAHVVGNKQKCEVEFFPNGTKTVPIQGRVIWRRFRNKSAVDFAVIKVAASVFSDGWEPTVIPLLPADVSIRDQTSFYTAGCPEARWLQLHSGFVLSSENDRLYFTPPPLGGQSGSGFLVEYDNETYVGAVITWSIGKPGKTSEGFDKNYGGAALIKIFHGLITNNINYKEYEQLPDYYEYASHTKENTYALAEDGKYYLEKTVNGQRSVVLPPGKSDLEILSWGHHLEPSGWGVPGGGGQSPGPQPIPPSNDGLPPGFGDSAPKPNNSLKKENEELKESLEECQKEKGVLEEKQKELQLQLDGLNEQQTELQKEYSELQKKYEEVVNERNELEEENQELKKEIEQLGQQIVTLQGEIKTVSEHFVSTKEELTFKIEKIEVLSTKFEESQQKISELQSELEKEEEEAEVEEEKEEEEDSQENTGEKQESLIDTDQFLGVMLTTIMSVFSILAGSGVIYYGGKGISSVYRQYMARIEEKSRQQKESSKTSDSDCLNLLRKMFSDVDIQAMLESDKKKGSNISDELLQKISEICYLVQSDQKKTDIETEKPKQDKKQDQGTDIPDLNHPDYRTPPPPVSNIRPNPGGVGLYPRTNTPYAPPRYKYDPENHTVKPVQQQQQQQSYEKTSFGGSPRSQHGLGPVPPEHPGHMYSTGEILHAIDEVVRRHPQDTTIATFPNLIRQILNEPARAKSVN